MHDLRAMLESQERYLWRREKIFSIYHVNVSQRLCQCDDRDIEQILWHTHKKKVYSLLHIFESIKCSFSIHILVNATQQLNEKNLNFSFFNSQSCNSVATKLVFV